MQLRGALVFAFFLEGRELAFWVGLKVENDTTAT